MEIRKVYDYLVVGSGLFGSSFAYIANKLGKSVLVIDKKSHIGGTIYSENVEGIEIHKYGPHIFYTNDKEAWDFINLFSKFNNFVNSPMANYNGELYNLPFNMNTFCRMFGVNTPDEVRKIIDSEISEYTSVSSFDPELNLKNKAISLVGKTIFNKLIEGYTEKQWHTPCDELPAFIIKRLPLRFTYNNNYFNARYQGIPINGYTNIIKNMLYGIEVMTDTDYFQDRDQFDAIANKIIYTGRVDTLCNYKFGILDYVGLRFEEERFDTGNYQGVAVMNYTDSKTPYTRITEHKHFTFQCENGINKKHTYIMKEIPVDIRQKKLDEIPDGTDYYYPMLFKNNVEVHTKYIEYAKELFPWITVTGLRGLYRYLDMHQIIHEAIELARSHFGYENVQKVLNQ